MTKNPFTDLFEALDTAPMICMLNNNSQIVYGPFDPAAALDFCATWNEFFSERGMAGEWIARPMLTPPA